MGDGSGHDRYCRGSMRLSGLELEQVGQSMSVVQWCSESLIKSHSRIITSRGGFKGRCALGLFGINRLLRFESLLIIQRYGIIWVPYSISIQYLS
jgi:hypothetical protein